MRSRPSNVEPLERRLKNSAAVSPLRGRSIAIMQIRHKRIDAGEACPLPRFQFLDRRARRGLRSEEHTSELQSLMCISYAVFCLKKKTTTQLQTPNTAHH